MYWRRLYLSLSTPFMAVLMLEDMWIIAYMVDMWSSSTPGIFWIYERMRSVGILAGLVSCASLSLCWKPVAVLVTCAKAMCTLSVVVLRILGM